MFFVFFFTDNYDDNLVYQNGYLHILEAGKPENLQETP